MSNELVYQIALSMVPNIGAVHARLLVEAMGEASGIFSAKTSSLEKIEGIGRVRANAIKAFNNFKAAEQEIKFIEQYHITPLYFKTSTYPTRLTHCYDAPILLYYRGKANLNHTKIISVVGTRSKTAYGQELTEKLIKDLADYGVLVLSGLASGIDSIAHRAALKNKLPTVGVLAHGLDTIYPPENNLLAKEMLQEEGGLLTEFCSGTFPNKHNFPSRNRIVAGMCDALIVVETPAKGGSLITAELASNYHKDVFAFAGRVADVKSAGCHQLIKSLKAALITEAKDIVHALGWNDAPTKCKKPVQQQLFVTLTAPEQKIVDILQEKEIAHIEELHFQSGLNSSTVATAILTLELQQVLTTLPGKRYKLL
jgi:DNA processing protein